jgi:hypothetical protein
VISKVCLARCAIARISEQVREQLVSVGVCVAGVFLVAFAPQPQSSSGENESTALGYIMLLLSTAFYAVYEVLYEKYVAVSKPADALFQIGYASAFVGMMGLWSIVAFWPGFLIANATGKGSPRRDRLCADDVPLVFRHRDLGDTVCGCIVEAAPGVVP